MWKQSHENWVAYKNVTYRHDSQFPCREFPNEFAGKIPTYGLFSPSVC